MRVVRLAAQYCFVLQVLNFEETLEFLANCDDSRNISITGKVEFEAMKSLVQIEISRCTMSSWHVFINIFYGELACDLYLYNTGN